MGLITKLFKTATIGGAAAGATFIGLTRKCTFPPVPETDYLFTSPMFAKYNPNQNPVMADDCVRRVRLSDIKPELLENKGELVKAFCAGVWSGYGYAYQRRYLERKYRGSETSHQLWDRPDLKASSYAVGTQITDHFEVLEHTPERVVVRCGDTPRITDVRASEGLFEMSVERKEEEGVVDFHLKSLFYQGQGKAEKPPMDGYMQWLHQQYDKLWMETALMNVKR